MKNQIKDEIKDILEDYWFMLRLLDNYNILLGKESKQYYEKFDKYKKKYNIIF